MVLRQNKYKAREESSKSEFWTGYEEGWFWAYKDLMEILEQNGFNMDVVVIGDGAKNNTPKMSIDEVLEQIDKLPSPIEKLAARYEKATGLPWGSQKTVRPVKEKKEDS